MGGGEYAIYNGGYDTGLGFTLPPTPPPAATLKDLKLDSIASDGVHGFSTPFLEGSGGQYPMFQSPRPGKRTSASRPSGGKNSNSANAHRSGNARETSSPFALEALLSPQGRSKQSSLKTSGQLGSSKPQTSSATAGIHEYYLLEEPTAEKEQKSKSNGAGTSGFLTNELEKLLWLEDCPKEESSGGPPVKAREPNITSLLHPTHDTPSSALLHHVETPDSRQAFRTRSSTAQLHNFRNRITKQTVPASTATGLEYNYKSNSTSLSTNPSRKASTDPSTEMSSHVGFSISNFDGQITAPADDPPRHRGRRYTEGNAIVASFVTDDAGTEPRVGHRSSQGTKTTSAIRRSTFDGAFGFLNDAALLSPPSADSKSSFTSPSKSSKVLSSMMVLPTSLNTAPLPSSTAEKEAEEEVLQDGDARKGKQPQHSFYSHPSTFSSASRTGDAAVEGRPIGAGGTGVQRSFFLPKEADSSDDEDSSSTSRMSPSFNGNAENSTSGKNGESRQEQHPAKRPKRSALHRKGTMYALDWLKETGKGREANGNNDDSSDDSGEAYPTSPSDSGSDDGKTCDGGLRAGGVDSAAAALSDEDADDVVTGDSSSNSSGGENDGDDRRHRDTSSDDGSDGSESVESENDYEDGDYEEQRGNFALDFMAADAEIQAYNHRNTQQSYLNGEAYTSPHHHQHFHHHQHHHQHGFEGGWGAGNAAHAVAYLQQHGAPAAPHPPNLSPNRIHGAAYPTGVPVGWQNPGVGEFMNSPAATTASPQPQPDESGSDALDYKQTPVEVKVHVLLGYDPESDVTYVRSPDWSALE